VTALAVVCATWLDDVGMTDFQALRLAPPVLEVWAPKGQLRSRRVEDFGLPWSLPAAEATSQTPDPAGGHHGQSGSVPRDVGCLPQTLRRSNDCGALGRDSD